MSKSARILPELPSLPKWAIPAQKSLRYQHRSIGAGVRNQLRRWRDTQVGYVVFPISGSLPERSAPPPSFVERQLGAGPRALSLQTINFFFEQIINASNVKGVVLIVREVGASPARLQSMRRSIERLREAGKRVVVFTPYLSMSNYYLAAAADLIIVPPSAEFDVVGLQSEAVFVKDALAMAGIEGEMIAVSPYKTAGSEYTESDLSVEAREQMNWLIDDVYDVISADIARDRGMEPEEVKGLINWAPFGAQDAVDNNLIDAVGYEDELPEILAQAWPDGMKTKNGRLPRAKLSLYSDARKKLIEHVQREHNKAIGVVQIRGGIMMTGGSSPLPLPINNGPVASEKTITRLLRSAEKDKDIAALVIYIDSGGGSALASDLIWRQVERIRHKKPVVIYMGGVAASGGYYIAAGGDHIMAHPSTITGSIGVVTARMSTAGLEEKLNVKHVRIKRGNNAGIYRDTTPLTSRERAIIWARITETYQQFKDVVAASRDLDVETLELVCGGRVWTGQQALERGLIDSFGDFADAVEKAKMLANLPQSKSIYVPVRSITAKSSYQIPKSYSAAEQLGLDSAEHPLANLTEIFDPSLASLFTGEPLYLLPFKPRFW